MEKLTSGANSISNSVKRSGDAARINTEMSQIKRETEKLYMQLGVVLKEANKDGFGIEEADGLSAKIDELQARNEELVRELAAVRGRRYCVKCNTELAADSLFCPECGARNELPKAEEPEPDVQDTPAAPESENRPDETEQPKVRRVVAVKSVAASAPVSEPEPERVPEPEPVIPQEPAVKVCPKCGNTEAPDAMFCSECGTRL